MGFKSYWEFSDKERSELTENEVTRLLDAELMVNGVMRPEKPPAILTVADLDLPKRAFARVSFGPYGGEKSAVVFDTIEQAEAFVKLSPRLVVDDWETRQKYTKGLEGAQVSTELFTDEGEVVAAKVELKRIVAQRAEIERAQREYAEQSKKVESVTSRVWDDWHAQRSTANDMIKVQITFDEYVKMTQGNHGLAISFLLKIFDAEKIRNAAMWVEDKDLANALESHFESPAELPPAPPPAVAKNATVADDIAF